MFFVAHISAAASGKVWAHRMHEAQVSLPLQTRRDAADLSTLRCSCCYVQGQLNKYWAILLVLHHDGVSVSILNRQLSLRFLSMFFLWSGAEPLDPSGDQLPTGAARIL